MFHKLRNQFIITTMAMVSIVLIISFTMIYVSTANNLTRTPRQTSLGPNALRFERFDSETRTFFEEQRREYAEQALTGLMLTLITTGVVTLTAVFFLSRFMANRAVSVIEDAYTKQRQFIADASHELKTPITVISANADAAISDLEKPSKWLTNIKTESGRMGRLVDELLQLARLDTSMEKSQFTTFELSKLVEDTVGNFIVLAAKKDIKILHSITESIKLTSDADKLQQILTILIDNAVKYTESGGKVTVASVSQSDTVILRVSNTHPQIDAAELDKFFDRFYQGDSSHRASGHGLGLAIAKESAEQLDASLKAWSTSDMISFDLEIPAR